jgi:type IV pilus assembly protein PilX
MHSIRRSPPSLRQRNTGVALFISLVLLLLLTIIAVSSVQTTTLEVRMARNDHDTLLAFQATETALRDAEVFLETVTSTASFSAAGTDGLWTIADFGATSRWEIAGVWGGALSVVAPTVVAGVSAQPRFIIEHAASVLREENAYQLEDPYAVSAADRIEMFRVTARGVGGSPNAVVLLQSTYGRILD